MSDMNLAGSYDMVLAGKLRTAGNGEMGWMAQAQHILVSDSFNPYTQQIPHSEPPGILPINYIYLTFLYIMLPDSY